MFITRNNKDVYNSIGDRLIAESSINKAKSPGSKARALIAAISDELGSAYSTLDVNMAMTLVTTASGVFLDYIGEIYNVKRIRASGAHILPGHKMLKFYVIDGSTFGAINSGSSFVLPEGTKLASLDLGDKSVRYELDDDYTCNAGDTEVWVGATSIGQGDKFNVGANVIRSHGFNLYADSGFDSLQVTNVSAISTATDTETDDQYRYRIIKQATAGEQANETAIRLALLAIPGVSNVYFENYGYGIGTYTVYIKPVVISAGLDLIEQCEVQVDVTSAMGIVPVVSYLKRLGIEMELALTFRQGTDSLTKTNIMSEVKMNVMEYLANLDKDESFIVNEVVQVVMQTDERILNIGAANKPINRMWVWKDNFVDDGRYRQVLTSDLKVQHDEIITYEYTLDSAIRVVEKE